MVLDPELEAEAGIPLQSFVDRLFYLRRICRLRPPNDILADP